MVCYSVPLVSALIVYMWRRATHNQKPEYLWLNLMLLGGAIFGVVDHLWHGELFLISADWMLDLALGFAITMVIIVSWGIILTSRTAAEASTKSVQKA
ncbi:MAG: hypothetical protein J7L23_02595 [Candidatus Diapherotrites archaeon]|nr:hypothetical protein [Candidatus Diapherotrites archaeon]